MATDKIYTQGEIVEAIKTKAQSLNLDSFRVRVNRRDLPHLPPNILATFDDVTQAHILGPELWLLDLFGGGSFELTVSHASDPNTALPGPLKLTYDSGNYPVKKPNYNEVTQALSQPSWLGPTKMIFPRPPNAPPGLVQTTVNPTGAPSITALGSTTSVGGSAAAPLTQTIATSTNPVERQEASRLMQVSDHLERKERELFEKQMELKMEQMRQPAAAPEKGPSMSEMLAGATPLILAFLQQKADTDKMLFQAQQDAAARQIAMQQEASTRQLEMMKMMMDLSAAKKPDDFGQMKMVAELMGTMTNTTMQVIQSNAEMMNASAPQQEPPSYKLARQAMVALSAIMSKTPAAVLPDDESQPQLPPGGAESQQQEPLPKKYSQLELLERSIMRHDEPEKVAARFLKALKSPKFINFVRENYGGNIITMANARLGNWAAESAENTEYAQALIPFLIETAQKAGVMAKTEPKAEPVEAKPESEPAPSNGAAAHAEQAEAPPTEAPRRKKHVAAPEA